jgi:hypothetical protein
MLPSLFEAGTDPVVRAAMVVAALCMALLANNAGTGFKAGTVTLFATLLLHLLALYLMHRNDIHAGPDDQPAAVQPWKGIVSGAFGGVQLGLLVYAMRVAVARYTGVPAWASWLLGAVLGQIVHHTLAVLTRLAVVNAIMAYYFGGAGI